MATSFKDFTTNRKSRIFFILLCLVLTTGAVSPASKNAMMPFHPGEKLTYTLRWGVIHAGEATLEVMPAETLNNIPVRHFIMTARTNSFIDTFYKVRDRIDAYTDRELGRSVFYKKDQREGRRKRSEEIFFDWEKKQAVYANFGEKRPPVDLMPGSFDPLSALYYTRLCEISEKTVIERPVTDGKKNVVGRVKVVRRETIKIGDKKYDTFLLEPELSHVGGVFEKSKNAKIRIWITADHRRIPVKVESEVVIGSFVAELTEIQEGAPAVKK